MPPCGVLDCTVFLWRANCLLVEILDASSWRSWLNPCVDIGYLLVKIFVASSLPPCEELMSPCGELHFSTGFWCYDRSSWVFLSFVEGFLRCFCRLLDCATFSSSYGFLPLDQSLLVVPTLRSDCVSDVRIELRWFTETYCDVSSYSSLCFALLRTS